jgi:hybrid cluster-associated redox disulfide protein
MQQGAFSISGDTLVEEILDRIPLAAQVFVGRRMHCVGCPIARFETLAEACRIYRQVLDNMLADLSAVADSGNGGGHHG